MDKRFWGGAIAVLTVVVAGAGTLPGLLLHPTVEEVAVAGSVEPAPFVAKPKLAEAEPAPAAPPAPAAVVEPKLPPKPEPEPVVQAAQPAPAEAPQEPQATQPQPAQPAAANPISFPPVQPIGVATAQGLDAAPKNGAVAAAPTQSSNASARGGRDAAEKRSAARDTAKRKRAVRPAIFPMREFLAWRR
jgi:outer membrane biosynthesis protein TonB